MWRIRWRWMDRRCHPADPEASFFVGGGGGSCWPFLVESNLALTRRSFSRAFSGKVDLALAEETIAAGPFGGGGVLCCWRGRCAACRLWRRWLSAGGGGVCWRCRPRFPLSYFWLSCRGGVSWCCRRSTVVTAGRFGIFSTARGGVFWCC